jgi:hypothetical protein
MWGTKARQTKKGAVRFVSITLLHSPGVNSVRGFRMLIPALLMRMFTSPKRSITDFLSTSTSSSFDTSAVKAPDVAPKVFASFETSSRPLTCLDTRARFAPASPKARAIDLPKPLLAPVTRATLPFNFL